MIAKPRFHCWSNTQRLMNPAEVVMHVMERNSVLQILQLFAESVCESRESAHRHSHGQVLALYIASRNVAVIRIAANDSLASAHANCRTVASFSVSRRAVYLF